MDGRQPEAPYYTSPAQQERDEADAALRKLATRRQEADRQILEKVRAVVATTRDVEPEDLPTDRGWADSGENQYSMDHPLGFIAKDYSAKELMDFFKAHPSEVFPFPVSGSSSTFKHGAIFTLSDTLIPAIPVVFEEGDVVVTGLSFGPSF